MSQDVKDLLTYYSRQPDPMLARRAMALLVPLPEEQRTQAIEWIVNHIPKKTGLDIPAIKTAMAEVGATIHGTDEPPVPWDCDLCGYKFSWSQYSDSELRKHGIHDYCPRCGLAPADTMTAAKYRGMRGDGRTPLWYETLKADARKNHLQPGQRPRWDPKADEADDERQRRKKIDQLKAEARAELDQLAASKRVEVRSAAVV